MDIFIAHILDFINKDTKKVVLPSNAFYIGRPAPRFGLRGSGLANPFKVGQYPTNFNMQPMTLEDVLYWYRVWLHRSTASGKIMELSILRNYLKKNDSLILACWCAPKPCHAEIIRDALLGVAEFGGDR